jgi:DNA-binding IclR family transcriptional regulator
MSPDTYSAMVANMGEDVRISVHTGARSVDRAVSVLLLLGEQGSLGLGEIARSLAIPKSSAADVLRALVARDFVTRDLEGRYRLGLGAFEIGAAYLRAMTPVIAATLELEALTRELSATSHFAVLDGDEVIYLAKHEPPLRALELASVLGARVPAATTAVGKAQLAFVSARDVDNLFDSARFVEFTRIRALGYAFDEGGTAPGVACVAAPVFSPNGCCGAIGVSALIDGVLTRESVIRAVVAAAANATVRLGGEQPRAFAADP